MTKTLLSYSYILLQSLCCNLGYGGFMNHSMSSGGFALAEGVFADDVANSKKMKMLFMLIAAFVLYSDFYAPAVSVGHCAAISAQ